jgi:PAS domain S-box-containing protein
MKSEPPVSQERELLDSSPLPGVTQGVVFVVAAGGVRHLDRSGDGFLGYPQSEVFWKDALALVHDEDLPLAEAMISRVIQSPGASLSTELRFRDASGAWRFMDTCVQNVLEAPGDAGLVVVNLRDASWRETTG